jgi:hypothetical protein
MLRVGHGLTSDSVALPSKKRDITALPSQKTVTLELPCRQMTCDVLS